jgi:hypothetical protein
MDDFIYRRDDPRDTEIERLLDAFAELRLSPSVAATTRMRAGVMAAAHRRAALLQADAAAAALGSTDATASGVSTSWRALRWRRPMAALLGAALTLGVLAGTVAASSAGGPLYATRIWIETVNLPRDVLARAQAEVVRLDRRVQEAADASAAGDTGATEAALDAYSTIVAVATSETGGDPTAIATLDAIVSRHVTVLTALGTTVPAAARPAIEHALASSTKALNDLEQPGSTPPGSSNGQGAPGAPGGPGTSGGSGTQGGPAGPGAGPDKTPKPTPNVDKSSPRPDRTPRPDQRDPKASPTHPVPSHRQ